MEAIMLCCARVLVGVSFALTLAGLLGCQGESRRAAVQPATHARDGASLVIASNTQATLGDLRIGAGNVWDEEYQDPSGRWHTGPTAGLWFHFERGPASGAHRRVHAGETFVLEGTRFEVVDVSIDRVTLKCEPGPG